jgi:hypothetical protein
VHSLCKSLRIAAAGVEDNFDDRHRFQNGGTRRVDRFRLSVHRCGLHKNFLSFPSQCF